MSTADKSEKSTSVYVNRCFEDPKRKRADMFSRKRFSKL